MTRRFQQPHDNINGDELNAFQQFGIPSSAAFLYGWGLSPDEAINMQPQVTQLITLKNAWMASHILDAEFPTPLSQQGLAIYEAAQAERNATQIQDAPSLAQTELLSFYPVDCHPLTIRYAMVSASQWADQESEAMVEFLTQIMLDDNSPARLYVGFYQGKPAACGMIFSHPDCPDVTLISDVCAFPLTNQDALASAMTAWLIAQASEQAEQLWIC